MEEIVGQLKWTTTTNHTKGQSSTKEGAYGGARRESSIMTSFFKTKQLIPTSIAPN